MAKKVLLQDLNNVEILPITRGELVLDSSGKKAFHSSEFLATTSLPGLMSAEDKHKLDNYAGDDTTYNLVSVTADGLAPKIGNSAELITTQEDEWVLTTTKGETPSWRKLPISAFSNAQVANSKDDDGYVLKGSGQANKVWQTDPDGNPAWRDASLHKHTTEDIALLTDYTKGTKASDLVATDTLNTALGKLEYKTDIAYNLIQSAYDGDGTIENLNEILKVLEGIKDTETIQAIIGKYLPLAGGHMTGNITWETGTGYGTRLPAHIYRNSYDNDGRVYDHYYHPGEEGYTNSIAELRVKSGTSYRTLRFGGDGDFTWMNYNVLHANNYTSYTVKKDGTGALGTWNIDISGKASRAVQIDTTSIKTEQDIVESGLRTYAGSGQDWAGSIKSMLYAAIIALGGPSRGLQIWARRGTGAHSSIHYRVSKEDTTGWEAERTLLDNYNSSVTGTSSSITVNLGGTSQTLTIPSSLPANGGTASSANWLNSNDKLEYGASGLNYFNINGTEGNDKSNCTPTSSWYHIIRMNHRNSVGYLVDIAAPVSGTSGIYWRQIANGTFRGWYKILDSNNYNSYALPLAGGTLTGRLTISNDNWGSLLVLNRNNNGSNWGPAILFNIEGSNVGTLTMSSNNLYIGDNGSIRYKAWHEGNDGSGSGLDADLLDGTHKADLFTSLTNVNTEDNPYSLSATIGGTTKFLKVNSFSLAALDIRGTTPTPNDVSDLSVTSWFNNKDMPAGAYWYSGITVAGWSNNYRVWLLASSSDQSDAETLLYFRTGRSDTWGTWRTILDSSNTHIKSGVITINGTTITPLTLHQSLTNYYTKTESDNRFYGATINRTANTVLAAPNGSAGVASFRKLVVADMPDGVFKHLGTENKASVWSWGTVSGTSGWNATASDRGYRDQYGTNLDISGFSTWYHRLAMSTDGRIEYWHGINTKTLTKLGTIAWTSEIPTKVSQLENDSNYVTGGPYLPTSGTNSLSGSIVMQGDFNTTPFIRNFTLNSTSYWARNIMGILVDGSSKFVIGAYGSYTKGSSSNGITYAYLGCNSYDGLNLRITADSLKWGDNTILHAGNSSVSGGGSSWGSSITVNINGTSNTLTIPSNPLSSIKTLTFSSGTFATKTYNGSANVTVNVPNNFNHISDASNLYVDAGTVIRRIIVQNTKNNLGYISRASIGLSNPANQFSPVIIGVGTNDAGTTYTDYYFHLGGSITDSKGNTYAKISDITKSQVGLENVQNTAFYKRSTTVNGTPWDMAGTVNGAAFTIFAPTTSGSGGDLLISDGGGNAPTWTNPGNVTVGGASKADKLTVARTIALSGAVTGSASFDGSANITIATSVNHTHSYLVSGSTLSGSSHAEALKTYFTNNKASIPRCSLNTYYSSAMDNGSLYFGYFLSGYDSTPYGGFYVAHYDTPYYVGISYGTFTLHLLAKISDLTWTNITGKPTIPTLYERNIGINGNNWTFSSPYNTATTTIYAPTSAGTSGQVLVSTGGTPIWKTISTGGGYIGTTAVSSSLNAGQNITGIGNILPNSTNSYDLGASDKYFYFVYANYVYGSYFKRLTDGDVYLAATNGRVDISCTHASTAGRILLWNQGFTPITTTNLGSATYPWLYVYAKDYYVRGSAANTTAKLTSDAADNIYLTVGGIPMLVCDSTMMAVRSSMNYGGRIHLGTSNYRWNYVYATHLNAEGGKFYTDANGAYWTSDARLKTNIVKARNLDIADLLVEFDWKDSGYHSWGYIAQDLLEILPEAVSYSEDTDRYSVNYNVAHSAAIASLTARIKELEEKLKKYGIW